MEFIQHTLNWIKGEIFEAVFIAIFRLLIIISGLLFWKFGETPNAEALLIPLIFIGVIATGTGLSMYFSNQKKLVEFEKSYRQDSVSFVQQEKERVEGFQYMYTVAKVIVSIFFILGVSSLWCTKNHYLHAVGIA